MKRNEFKKLVREEYKKKVLSEVRRIRNDTFNEKDVTPFIIAAAEAPLVEDVNDAFHSWWVVYNAILTHKDMLKYEDKSLGSKCNKINSLFNNLRESIADLANTLREIDQEAAQAQAPPTEFPDTSSDIGPF